MVERIPDGGRLSCRRFQRLLPAHLDGTLPSGERRAMEEHAAGCPACSLAARVTAQFLADPGGEGFAADPPAGLPERVSARLASRRLGRAARFSLGLAGFSGIILLTTWPAGFAGSSPEPFLTGFILHGILPAVGATI